MSIMEGYIVCDNQTKEKILKKIVGFKDYSFITESDLYERLTFKIKDAALWAIMEKYQLSYSLAKEYLSAVKMIEDKQYNNPKLDSVVSIYHYLLQNDYLIFDDLFKIRLSQYPITFVNKRNDREYKRLVSLTSKYTKVFEIKQEKKNYRPIVYKFKTILEETYFVFNEILKLLKQGISLNNIYIVNATDEYLFLFKRLARNYQISCNFNAPKNILSAPIIKDFLSKCSQLDSFEEILNSLNKNDVLFNKIVDTINKFLLREHNPGTCVDFLTNVFKDMSYPNKKYVEGINFVNNSFSMDDNDYVFYVGFNLGSVPGVYKEQAFLNDNELELLGYTPSYEKNLLEKENVINFINNTKNLYISYKQFAKTEEYLPSLLINELGLEVKEEDISFGNSKIEDDLRLSALYDDYVKYGNVNESLLKYGLQDIAYKSYNHKYSLIDKKILDERFFKKPLKMAYSNMKLYYACPFSYYADRILNLNEFKPQMAARLGTFSHAILEESYSENFNFNICAEEKMNEIKENAKDEFFFTQMKFFVSALIEFNRRFEAKSTLKNLKFEEHITVEYDSFSFEGYIDKLMYQIDGDDVYVAIIDYKTGKDIVSLDNINYGFNLQLPSYMYLISHYPVFKGLNIHIVGIYLQKLNIVIFDNKSDIQAQMEKNFRLEGYTTSCLQDISRLDPDYASSEYIKSLSLKKDGFGAYSKIFSPEQQKDIINSVENLIVGAAKNIKNGEYSIRPIMIDGKNKSCTFCKYKDICFYDYDDIVHLEHTPFGKGGE